MEELIAFCGFDIERLTSMQRLLEHTVRLAQSQNILIISAHCRRCELETIFDTKLRIRVEWDDPDATQTIVVMPAQVLLSALVSITAPRYQLGMHY
jgi:hypothetical protein